MRITELSTRKSTISRQKLNRWVGLGVIAGNLINIGRVMQEAAEP